MSTALFNAMQPAAPPAAASTGEAVADARVSGEDFRDAMAALAAPVTVVTCYDEHGSPRGLTASAVSALSLDPPLFLVCLDRGSRTHDALTGAPAFCVNVMGPGNEALARQFAGPTEHRFSGVRLKRAPEQVPWPVPLLADSALRLHCVHHAAVEGGDHTVLMGRVVDVDRDGGATGATGGLLWHRRGFAHARTQH